MVLASAGRFGDEGLSAYEQEQARQRELARDRTQSVLGAEGYSGLQSKYGYNVQPGTEALYDEDTARLGTAAQDAYGLLARQRAAQDAFHMDAARMDPGMVAMLRDAAMGNVPSAAELQMDRGLQQTLGSQLAARAAQRGGRVGASNRLVADQAQSAQMDIAGQSAALRANEMMGARGQLAQTLGQQAQMQQGANAANLQAQMQNQQQIDAMTQFYLQQGYNIDEADRQARMMMANQQAGVTTNQMGVHAQKESAGIGAVGTGLAAAGQIGGSFAMSDVRAKQNIKKADKQVAALLDGLSAYEFDYKDKKHGGNKNLGIMAQDLEKSDLGKQLVVDGPLKMVDLRRALMAGLAANASLHKRLKKVEGK